jgi:hemerythrin-like domain-containing protein
MLDEHVLGREFVKAMGEAVDRYGSEGEESLGRFAENARSYAQLLERHIDKENNILYPKADMHLSEDQQQALEVAFAEVERERIGPGRHEGFHELLAELKSAYLE